MRIEIKEEVIKHDGEQYKGGEVRDVDPDIGEYFCGMGWARDLTEGPDALEDIEPNRDQVVDIDIPPSRLGTSDTL